MTAFPEVVRRRTTGTAAWIGRRALWCSLALPAVDALYDDATLPTLLNRNVRPWLRGFTRSGIPAAYFGRECERLQRTFGEDMPVVCETFAVVYRGPRTAARYWAFAQKWLAVELGGAPAA